ncbi:hypothetical protein LZ554_001333 [Drepanopeziza brunnea f. sp. 'monogermtubi']|nr:hypothetical protein LZ554_001333 [Drepanopeziza brunnea f. sp. 'monogermtubi']
MLSLKDIMDVDVEPLESQAYRRSREAAQQQLSLPLITPSTETLPTTVDINTGQTPLKRRRSNRVSKPSSQPTAARQGCSSQMSNSGSPRLSSSGPEPVADMPVKYTSVTARISKAKKGVPVHTCDMCRPVKTFTRAEHLRRHQLSHQKPAYPCTFEDCKRAFHRPDLLARHLHRHETQGEKPYRSGDLQNSRASSTDTESRTPDLKVKTLAPGSLEHAVQTSPTDSLTPRTGGSGESSTTAASFSTITDSFQAVNFSPGSGHKRFASQAQLLKSESYPVSSAGLSTSDPFGNFASDAVHQTFGEGFGESLLNPVRLLPNRSSTPGSKRPVSISIDAAGLALVGRHSLVVTRNEHDPSRDAQFCYV